MLAFDEEEPSHAVRGIAGCSVDSLCGAGAGLAEAQAIHIVVGFAPASTTDLVARLVAPKQMPAMTRSRISSR
jgi:tripartite-type tricarboxylate transporter receptor subunit TctC